MKMTLCVWSISARSYFHDLCEVIWQVQDVPPGLADSPAVFMGAQLGVPYGHMGCRQFGVQFGYLDVYDLPFCVPYDVVLLLDVPAAL